MTDLHANEAWYAAVPDIARRGQLLVVSGDLTTCGQGETFLRGQRLAKSTLTPEVGVPIVVCSGNHDSDHGDVEDGGRVSPPWYHNMRVRRRVVVDQPYIAKLGGHRVEMDVWPDGEVGANLDAPDIVLCHMPPGNCGAAINRHGEDQGEIGLDEYFREGDGVPWLYLCGHVHSRREWLCRVGKTWVINPGCNRAETKPRWVEIDLTKRTATLFIEGKIHSVNDIPRSDS